MARILLTYPSKKVYGDGCLECGCPLLITGIKTLAYPHQIVPYGFNGQGTCLVESARYTYSFSLNIVGEEMSGTITFTNRRGKSITNVLTAQKTAYPSLPYVNEWTNLKVPGYGSNAVLTIRDSLQIAKLQNNQNKLTNDLTSTFNFTAINTLNNTIISTDSISVAPYNCNNQSCLPYSSNTWLWQAPKSTTDIRIAVIKNLPSTPISEDPNGGARTYIELKLNSLIVDESVGSLQMYGVLNSITQLPDLSTTSRFAQVTSDLISLDNLFKSVDNWTKTITIVDTLTPSLGLIKNPSSFLPVYNSDLQLVLTVTFAGKYDSGKQIRI